MYSLCHVIYTHSKMSQKKGGFFMFTTEAAAAPVTVMLTRWRTLYQTICKQIRTKTRPNLITNKKKTRIEWKTCSKCDEHLLPGSICIAKILEKLFSSLRDFFLSGEFSARQAQTEVVKTKNLDFSYWAWSISTV